MASDFFDAKTRSRKAAIHGYGLSVDVAGVIRCQEYRYRCDFIGISVTAQRYSLLPGCTALFRVLIAVALDVDRSR